MKEATMILSGFIMLTLIFLLSTFIAKKTVGLRVSGSSIIASLSLSFPSSIALITLFPTDNVSKWVVAFYMLSCVAAYMVWLWIFQPDSLLDLTKKELKSKQLENVAANQKHLLQKMREARKAGNTQQLETLKGQWQALKYEKKQIKQNFSRFKPIRAWFKKEAK